MVEPVINLRTAIRGRSTISDCCWKLRTFVERDAYLDYDYVGQLHPEPNRISMELVHAMNRSLLMRSPNDSWERLAERDLDELVPIPVELDLIDSPDDAVRQAYVHLRQACRRLMAARGIAEVASTAVLHLLRPRFIAIAAPYVRHRLGVTAPASENTEERVETILAVQRGMRLLGKTNAGAVSELYTYANTLPPVTRSTGPFAGQAVPIILSKLRTLDILLWTDAAIYEEGHHAWTAWYAEHAASVRGDHGYPGIPNRRRT